LVSLNWLPEAGFLYLLIFARVGTMLMLIPALGEQIIPARMRLGFALAFTLVLYPLLSSTLPGLPADILGVVVLLLHELAVGLILGALSRLIVMGTQIAGSIIAFQTGLSVAQSADPTNGGIQGAIVGSFLSFLGIALIFATDLHHVALSAIHDSYMIFSPAAPFIVFGLVFYLGIGVLARLMPQLQVFFIAMPATITVGLILLALLLTMMMSWYLMHFENEMAVLRGVA
jgi:flagellar biosynthesis protein FliR